MRLAPRTWSTTNVWAASSAPSPARSAPCSTTPTRPRPTSATCAKAIPPARMPAPPPPSPSRRGRRRTGSVSSRPSAPHACSRGRWRDAAAASRHRRRDGRPQRHPHHPRRGRRRLRDHPRLRGAPVLAHGAAVLPGRVHRGVPRIHGHSGLPRRVEGEDHAGPPRQIPRPGGTHPHPRRRRHRGVRQLRYRHRLARGAAARGGGRAARGAFLLDPGRGARGHRRRPARYPRRHGRGGLHCVHHPQRHPGARCLSHHRGGRPAHPPPHGGRGLRADRSQVAGEARRHPAGGRHLDSHRGVEGSAQALLQEGRSDLRRRGDHGHGHPDESGMAGGLGHRSLERARGRCPRGRSPALEREERLRGRRCGPRAQPPHGHPRGACDRAHGAGARARGRGQPRGARSRLSRQPHHEHRGGVSPRRGVLRAVGKPEGGGVHGDAVRPIPVPEAPVRGRPPHRRHDLRTRGRRVVDQRRGHAQGPRLLGERSLRLEGASEAEPLRRQARLPREPHGARAPARDEPGAGFSLTPAAPSGDGPMSPTATAARPRKKTTAALTSVPGYAGKLLRVNLTTGKIWTEPWAEHMRDYLGGVGLGAKILYEEVGPKVHWDHPDNRLILATGPLAGLPVWGTGGLSVITRGAQTDGATSTQANGFFGAALKYSGYDAIVVQGQAKALSYLYINDDTVEIRSAAHLKGKDTWETQEALEKEHGLSGHRLSVYSIGPAGENLVRFAAIQGDYGHVASKNGCGAVMGKKKLKAVCIVRGTKSLRPHDPRGLVQAADDIAHDLKTDPASSTLYRFGTLPGVSNLYKLGVLPIKNYTTNLTTVDMTTWEPAKLRNGFDHRGHQCNACGMHHCHIQVIGKGPKAGELVDEPEYEGWSGAGWQIGLTDKEAITWLNTRLDRACLDVNEFGWVCGWVMECMEKGYLTEKQVGFRLNWGDVDGAYKLIQMISHRQGFGDLLAEGVKRASEKIGGEAAKCAVYTMKGASPRGHDHRGRWEEMLDTCTSSNGTMESANATHQMEIGLPGRINPYNGEEVARMVGGILGRKHFEDSLGGCIFTFRTRIEFLARALSAATGWTYTLVDALRLGRRTAAILRAFNLRCGIGTDLEYPSARYGSQPVDGPAKDHHIMAQWERMREVWYETVGYDIKTGKPTRETLHKLGLDWLARDLWRK